MVLLLVFMQLTRDLFAIAKFLLCLIAGMSIVKELFSIESHYFSITVTQRFSVNESLGMCYKVKFLFCSSVVVDILDTVFVLDLT